MVYFYASRICRNISCLSVTKILVTVYSTTSRSRPAKVLHEPPCLTIAENYHAGKIANLLILQHVNRDIQLDTALKDKELLQNSEWRCMRVDTTKVHKHCLMLSKIRLTSLVVITTMAGYAVAPGPFDIYAFAMCSIGTGLMSAAANSVNQYFEMPFDAQMSRTKNRVLVRGHLTPAHAVAFAVVSGLTGLYLLYHEVNAVTAALGATNLFLYTLIYTPMKRISILNTWVGSVVGAIPPLMGWAGCAGNVMVPGAWIMPGLLYAWQFPHFNALSWNLRPDYSRAGYRMMAVTNPDLCRKTALRYTAVLSGLCCMAPMVDVTNWWFIVASTPLNIYFLYLAWQFYKNSDSGSSRKLFRYSLVYLPALMLLILLSKKYFDEEKEDYKSYNESE